MPFSPDSNSSIGLSMPMLEDKGSSFVDIDPFTVFGLFNKSSMRNANRVKILTELGRILEVSTPILQSFNGVPTLNNQSFVVENILYD